MSSLIIENWENLEKGVVNLLTNELEVKEVQKQFGKLQLKIFDDYPDFQQLDELLQSYWQQSSQTKSIGRYYLFATIATNLVNYKNSWDAVRGGYIPKSYLLENLFRICSQEREKTDNPFADIFMGVAYHIIGENLKSYECFGTAANHPKLRQVVFDDKLGCLTTKPWSVSEIIHYNQEKIQTPQLSWELSKSEKLGSFVVSFFCDDVYFQAFTPYIIDSLLNVYNGGEFCIHFHVTNMGDKSKQLAKLMQEKISNISVSLFISKEETKVQDRAYFTVSRFLHIENLIKYFDKDIIVLDADCDFQVSPIDIWEHFKDFEVGGLFCRGPWGYLPWRSYWAGFNYFANKRGGWEFAKLLKRVINYLWNEDRGNWWIDQNALYMTMRLMQVFYPELRFFDIGGKLATSLVRSGEELKISRLSALENVKKGLNEGKHWTWALAEIQLDK